MTTQLRNPELVNLLKADFINCWIPISEYTAAGPVATITFANIPQTFRSIVFSINARTDRASTVDAVTWRANADAGNNYDYTSVVGNNAVASSANGIGVTAAQCSYCDAANSRASCFGGAWVWFPNYRNTNQEKDAWSVGGSEGTPTAATMRVAAYNSHWRSTNAITDVVFLPTVGPNFVQYTNVKLWGVL